MNFFTLLMESDIVTKIIIGMLGIVSIVNSGLILRKLITLYRESRSMNRLLDFIESSKSREELSFIKKQSFSGTTRSFFEVTLMNYDELFITASTSLSLESKKRTIEVFEEREHQAITKAIMHIERGLPLLGISAAVSPLIGLFGTVWGLIHSFISMSHERSADLLVVAPGIAEALITTLAGLIVAIPATIFFHYFSNEIRKIENTAVECVDELTSFIHRSKVSHEEKKKVETIFDAGDNLNSSY